MSDYAWLGVLLSSSISTLAVLSYGVMAMPYFDNAPYLTELKKNTKKTALIGVGLYIAFFTLFYLSALHVNTTNSGPLLIFSMFVLSLPVSLLLGSETWDRHDGHGMSRVPGQRAVAVATGIGLAELMGAALIFFALFWLT
jgi:hypothetical protein